MIKTDAGSYLAKSSLNVARGVNMARFLSSRFGRVFAAAFCIVVVGTLAWAIDEYKSGKIWPEPKVVTPGDAGSPPSDAIVLFDGKDLSQWHGGERWKVKDGVATSAGADIDTKQEVRRHSIALGIRHARSRERQRARPRQQRHLLPAALRIANSRFVQQPDLFRRPMWRCLQATSAAGECMPQAGRMADL